MLAIFKLVFQFFHCFFCIIGHRKRYVRVRNGAVFSGVAERLREKGFDVMETGEKEWTISKKNSA